MARRIVHQLVDDIDGSVEVGEGETVRFSLNSATYEIDLNEKHAAELRAALEPFIAAGRRAGSTASVARAATPRKRATRNPEVAAIRAWANDNGYTLSERGRIPAVVKAYNAAH